MWGQVEYEMAKQRQADYLREAEAHRRAKDAQAAQKMERDAVAPGNPATPVLHAVGRGLVAAGSRLMAL